METVAIEDSWIATDNVIKILWNIGKRCNFNCSYCHVNNHDNFSPHLSLEVCKKTIDTLIVKTNKELSISLTGGEPTVNPNFIEIIRYMSKKGVSQIGLTTNGSRTKEFYLETMKYLDNIVFSYHMEYHTKEKILDNILACHYEKDKRCLQVAVHVMMLPTMFEEAKELMYILKENEVKIIMRRIRPAFEKDRLIKGEIAKSQKPILLFHDPDLGPDNKGRNYYSEEELAFLKEYKV